MDLGIVGRKAIVCASSKGLGLACATALAEAGCEIVLNGRDGGVLGTAAAAIRAATGTVVHEVVADVATAEGQKALLSACQAPDILINNNAGPRYRDFRDLDRAAILEGVTGNMVTPIELIQAVIDGMAERGFGRIVNITSASVYAPVAGLDLSSGARAGLVAFLAGVARTVADRNVTINNMMPGIFATDRMTQSLAFAAASSGQTTEWVADGRRSGIPARRFGMPEEFGRICAFLCSDHASYIVGQNIVIDGGAHTSAF